MKIALFENHKYDAQLVGHRNKNRDRTNKLRADSRVPLSEHAILEGYQIQTVIGRGSFSLVYSALEIKSGHGVIIKEYYPKRFAQRLQDGRITPVDGTNSPAFEEGFRRFRGEAMAVRKIQHPNVLSTTRIFRANQTAYMVFLNQNGRDLKWFVSTSRYPMNQKLLYQVVLPVLSALSFLHQAKLLHLDIKPANILLQPNGESLLLDFGAAQTMGSRRRVRRPQILTHGFAAPEQYDKNRALGPWTDIYAVAATLYYCIAGCLPAKSMDEKAASRLSFERYSKSYHPFLIRAINRSLSLDEVQRFDCIDSFATAFLEGSKWVSLREYEVEVLAYDRFSSSTLHAREKLLSFAA